MKNLIVLGVFIACFVAGLLSQQFSASMGIGAITGCPAPASGQNIMCSVTDGIYASIGGSAYAKINASAGGVVTFNGRSGNVVPVANDYSYSQLSSPPTKISCTTAQISAGGTGSFTASGCTIN